MYTNKKTILHFGDMVVQWLVGVVLSARDTVAENLCINVCVGM